MHSLTKIIHLLALGLWFGSAVFFTFIVALTLLHTFESLGANRPPWLSLPADFDKEQGTRLFGVAVSPIFLWYFLLQGVCGGLAAFTALSWSLQEPWSIVHKVRTLVLLLALATVFADWLVARKVGELRGLRYESNEVIAASARIDFATWHNYSLLLNFATLIFVTTAMCLGAYLPNRRKESVT